MNQQKNQKQEKNPHQEQQKQQEMIEKKNQVVREALAIMKEDWQKGIRK